MPGLKHVALLLGLLSAAASASWPQRVEPPVLSIETDLVSLTVTVIDQDSALVSGLRQKDFTVYDHGQPQTTEFFSSEDVAATIGLLIDSSGSMRGRRDDVTAAAEAFAAMCHPLDEFFTLNFNKAVWPGLAPHVPFTEDASRLRTALASAPAQGMIALYDAVSRGHTYLRRGSARQSEAVIYAVTFFDPDNRDGRRHVLKTLTRDTGGHAFTVKNSDDLTRAFAQIARELRSGHTIGFVPSDTSHDGFRSVRVVVDAGDRRQLTARTRAGYYAGPSP